MKTSTISPTPGQLQELYEYDILDTPEETSFNDLAELAQLLSNCPIASITFIDSYRQWFKSRKNIAETETSLAQSFCAYTVAQNKTIQVEDTLLSERFSNFANVTGGLKIRYYAGSAIRTPSGLCIGTLCVMDTQPRKLIPAQLAALEKLAAQVAHLLELRLLNKRLEKTALNLSKKIESHRELFNNAVQPQWINNADGKILAANKAAAALYGYSNEEFERTSIANIVNDTPQALQVLYEETKKNDKLNLITTHRKKNGDIMVVDFSLSPISYQGQEAFLAVMLDLSEKRQLQRSLENEKKEVKYKVEKATLSAQQQEREYLGRELHDNINQMLASVQVYLDLAFSNTEIRLKLIEQCRNYLSLTIEEIRGLSHKLVSSGSTGLDLKEAISELLAPHFLSGKFKIILQFEGDLNFLPVDVKIPVLRVLQEAIQNIDKYAQASKVEITLKVDDGVQLMVKDNGRGFDYATVQKGIGLRNIQERTDKLRGKVDFDSAPGKGCTVHMRVPLLAT